MGGPYDEQWSELNGEVEAITEFNEVQEKQKEIIKKREVNTEVSAKKLVQQIKKFQDQKKEYQRKVKNNLEQLIELLTKLPPKVKPNFAAIENIPIPDLVTKTNDLIGSGTTLINSNITRINSAINQKLGNAPNVDSKLQYLIIIFVKAFNRIRSELPELLVEETINQLGCSQEQTYLANDLQNVLPSTTNPTGSRTGSIYIPIQSLDFYNILQTSPSTNIGKIFYETGTTWNIQANGTIPFNKELHSLTQDVGVPYSTKKGNVYRGVSNQSLFNIEFVLSDDRGNVGEFYKVDLVNRLDNKNIVSQFLTDYYGTLEIVNLQNLFGQIFDLLCGAVSVQANLSSKQLEVKTKFQLLIERVLGLCFDNRQEIDVSGVSKVSPTQDVDTSFYEFTEIDLRNIDNIIDNIGNGVVEFEDCDNIKLPVNNEQIISQISNVLSATTSDEILQVFQEIQSTFVSNLKSNLSPNILIPSLQLKLAVDTELLKAIPKAMFASILSPKILIGFYIMFAATTSKYRDILYNLKNSLDFSIFFRKLFINFSSRVMAKFIKILVDEVKKEIILLLRTIILQLKKNVQTKKIAIILQLLTISGLIIKLIGDYRRCQSILDEIRDIINVALTGSKLDIPSILLPLARFRTGFSETRANLNIIKEFQRFGIPTGPMPDGQPNLTLQSFFSANQGIEKERYTNSYTKIFNISPPSVGLIVNGTPPYTSYGLNL
jgi:hypothetical protein